MSNLVSHARRELELVGEDESTIEGYLVIMKAFADMGQSGGSAIVAIPVVYRLMQFLNLTDITNNPQDWMHISPEHWGDPDGAGIWQCRRNPALFSKDGGNTYYNLQDPADADGNRPITEAVKAATGGM